MFLCNCILANIDQYCIISAFTNESFWTRKRSIQASSEFLKVRLDHVCRQLFRCGQRSTRSLFVPITAPDARRTASSRSTRLGLTVSICHFSWIDLRDKESQLFIYALVLLNDRVVHQMCRRWRVSGFILTVLHCGSAGNTGLPR